MPVYEYHCNQCGENFEELVRGEEKIRCSHCGSEQIKKKLSVSASPRVKKASHGCCRGEDCPVQPACGCGGNCPHHHH